MHTRRSVEAWKEEDDLIYKKGRSNLLLASCTLVHDLMNKDYLYHLI